MTALELAEMYTHVIRAYNYLKNDVDHRSKRIMLLEKVTGGEAKYWAGTLATYRTALKRNRRRLRQVSKLKTTIEETLSAIQSGLEKEEINLIWPDFMDEEGRCLPPWQVPSEVAIGLKTGCGGGWNQKSRKG